MSFFPITREGIKLASCFFSKCDEVEQDQDQHFGLVKLAWVCVKSKLAEVTKPIKDYGEVSSYSLDSFLWHPKPLDHNTSSCYEAKSILKKTNKETSIL